MKVFVTGFHRAGTHSQAEYLSKKHDLLYIEEGVIRWDSVEAVNILISGYYPKWNYEGEITVKGVEEPKLKNGFVLHCPGLAHLTEDLAKVGNVVWCQRDELSMITSTRNGNMGEMAWHLMDGFRDQYPNDLIWDTLEYDGHEDVHDGFVRYIALFMKVKKHFYEKYFKDIVVGTIQLEDQPLL